MYFDHFDKFHCTGQVVSEYYITVSYTGLCDCGRLRFDPRYHSWCSWCVSVCICISQVQNTTKKALSSWIILYTKIILNMCFYNMDLCSCEYIFSHDIKIYTLNIWGYYHIPFFAFSDFFNNLSRFGDKFEKNYYYHRNK